jgi:segregation and condensation protein A
VTRDELSVREQMSVILRRLHGVKYVEFTQLFGPEDGISRLVVTFLAILELAREALVEVTQQQAYFPIYVKPTHAFAVV